MKKIIYSKYSNDRSEAYKIRTDIVVDEFGKRYARKSAMTEKCKKHIDAMYENYLGLEEEFKDTCIRMNRCEKDGDALEFEYIEGKTYEVYLDELLEADRIEEFIDAIRKYVDVIKGAAAKDFVMTDAFRQIFGETPDFSGCKCLAISDVDMIFPNLMIRGEEWEVLDYEWSYAIPIPVDFIIYRAFHYYEAGQRHGRLKGICNLFRMFGIRQDTCKVFADMEQHFQNFLVTGNTPLWQIYQNLRGELYFPNGDIEKNRAENGRRQVRIVKDYGDAARNTDYFLTPVPDENGHISFDVPVDADVKTLVVYPAMRDCAVTVYEVAAMGFGTRQVSYLYNGFSSDNKNIYYTTEMPYLMFPSLGVDVSSLHFEMSVSFLEKTTLIHCADIVEQLRDNEKKLVQSLEDGKREGELHAQLREKLQKDYDNAYQEKYLLQQRLQGAEAEIARLSTLQAQLQSSFSWKVTKPLRKAKEILSRVRS